MIPHTVPNVDHHAFAFAHSWSSGNDDAISDRVLFVCGIVLAVLAISWASYGLLIKAGKDAKTTKLTLLCVSFAACSWGMNVLNKALVEALKAPSLVTAAQMSMTVMGVLLLGRNQLTYDTQQILKWSFVPFLFFGMLVSSFFTYEYMTLSMLMVIRNLGPMITLPIERMVMPADKQPVVSQKMIMALLVILVGAVVYSGEITTSAAGFLFALLNMLLAIADRVAQRRLLTSECKNLSTETCVLLNNLLGCVPTVALGTAVGELSQFDSKLWFHTSATLLLILSGVIGSGICYFAIQVQREISATSFMVLQNTARLAVVFAGVMIFHDPLHRSAALGLALSFGGAVWYGQTQLEAAAEARKAKATMEGKGDII